MSRSRPRTPSWLARIALAALLSLGLGTPLVAFTQTPPTVGKPASTGGPSWATLSPAQQSALAPLTQDWQDIDATRKQKWLEIAARFPTLPPDERLRVQQRMGEWARMTPDERGRARLQFQEARQISPQDRQARWDAYLALPADERSALAKSASTVPQAAAGPTSPRAISTAPVTDGKLNTGAAGTAQIPKSIAPVVVQAKPGASTTLISKTATPPAHAQAGQPRIAATPETVNGRTMLPQTGPQSAATAATRDPASAASAPSSR